MGHRSVKRLAVFSVARSLRMRTLQARAVGPFGFQPDNNATRIFEYPWAFHAVPVGPGDMVVDLGGSLAGLQFVLSKQGARVVNVDPSESASMGWGVDERTFATLNRAFGTSVELRKEFLEDAKIEADSIDRIYCISTIEHIPIEELPSLARELRRILKPGGFAVFTIDLFFDLAPFTNRECNVSGRNIDVCWLVGQSGLELFEGETSELFGYPDFDPPDILSRGMEFAQGDYAFNVAQAFVLRKPH